MKLLVLHHLYVRLSSLSTQQTSLDLNRQLKWVGVLQTEDADVALVLCTAALPHL